MYYCKSKKNPISLSQVLWGPSLPRVPSSPTFTVCTYMYTPLSIMPLIFNLWPFLHSPVCLYLVKPVKYTSQAPIQCLPVESAISSFHNFQTLLLIYGPHLKNFTLWNFLFRLYYKWYTYMYILVGKYHSKFRLQTFSWDRSTCML